MPRDRRHRRTKRVVPEVTIRWHPELNPARVRRLAELLLRWLEQVEREAKVTGPTRARRRAARAG
jgi:hypothetical protein